MHLSNDPKRPGQGPQGGLPPDKKPIVKYYLVVLGLMMLFNFLLVPWLSQREVAQVSYAQFDQMLNDKLVKAVQVGEGQITFSGSDGNQRRNHDIFEGSELGQ